jgi:hypothetical protein
MSRVLIVLLGVVMVGLLGGAPAAANADVVRIAEPRLADNATAATRPNNVHMEAARNTDLQRWRVDREQTIDAVRFVNVATGGCLSVYIDWTPLEGAPVIQELCVNDRLQLWQVVQGAVNGTVRIVNVGTGRCLTIEPFSTGQHPYLRVYTCGSQPSQDFRLVSSP